MNVPDDPSLQKELEELCKRAGELAIKCREELQSELKEDGSIVTNADRAVEEFIRNELAVLSPGTPIWGEEMGYEPPNEKGLWLIDPIDGTSNFCYGLPFWGVTVSHVLNGKIETGCINAPELGWSLAAQRGAGAFMNGERMPDIEPGIIESHNLVGYGDVRMPLKQKLPGKIRHVGAFVVEAVMFHTGGLRALITNGVRLYDAAAGILIAREIGAEVKELDGSEWEEAEWLQPTRCRRFGFFPKDSNWPFE